MRITDPARESSFDEFHHTCRDVLGHEDSARFAQLRQALFAEAECHPRVDELWADRVNANIRFLCEVRERPREVDHVCLCGGVDWSARHWPQADHRCGIDDHAAWPARFISRTRCA